MKTEKLLRIALVLIVAGQLLGDHSRQSGSNFSGDACLASSRGPRPGRHSAEARILEMARLCTRWRASGEPC